MSHNLYKGYVQLNDRQLWCDGSISVKPEHIIDFILKYNDIKLYTTKSCKDITEYNRYVSIEKQIIKKQNLDEMSNDWNIPDHYLLMDVKQSIYDKFFDISGELSDSECAVRINRIQHELKIFNKHNLFNLLRTLIYVIDEFVINNVVWGVGRGSSVSSYILYIIGVHDIDCIKYELDFDEFLT